MGISIRQGQERDFEAILALIKGLAVFQGMPEKVTNTVELMRAEQSFLRCLVAEDESREIVGIATYFYAYYTWVGKSLYLDDLYVQEAYRGKKIGSKLLHAVFTVAKEDDCKRVRWLVSSWNKPAIGFYKKCGAEIDEELMICDFDKAAITEFTETA